MIILPVLSENIAQCPKTLFLCLLYIYTFRSFVQWIDLDPKNPLQLAHFGYQDTNIFGTKVCGGSLDFNLSLKPSHISITQTITL